MPAPLLFTMRMDLFTCGLIVRRRLQGVPEIEKASRIEHFCQSLYIDHVKIEDLLEFEKTAGGKVDATGPMAGGHLTTNTTNRVA